MTFRCGKCGSQGVLPTYPTEGMSKIWAWHWSFGTRFKRITCLTCVARELTGWKGHDA